MAGVAKKILSPRAAGFWFENLVIWTLVFVWKLGIGN
jgi:hypothetical protein